MMAEAPGAECFERTGDAGDLEMLKVQEKQESQKSRITQHSGEQE